MPDTPLYMDASATTPVRPEALQAMWPYLTGSFGNPSSRHGAGEEPARALADARARVAAVLGVRAGEVVFTSGGTEAGNLAVGGIALGSARGNPARVGRILLPETEHEAVLASARALAERHAAEIVTVPVGPGGLVDPGDLERLLRPGAALASIAYANNEFGTVQDLPALAAVCRAAGVPLHTDAVQASGWLSLDARALGVDALSLSGHKVGAPKGIGALYVRGRVPLAPMMHGGGQERGRRSGTENVAGAVALATALELAEAGRAAAAERAALLREAFISRVLEEVPGAVLTGERESRLPGHASFCFRGAAGEAVLLELERRGILVSSGSACHAGSEEPPAALLALGLPPALAQTAVRVSFGADRDAADLERTARALRESVGAVLGIGR